MTFAYDEAQLVQRAARLSASMKMLVAALTAERLFPLFALYGHDSAPNDIPILRGALDEVWERCAGVVTEGRGVGKVAASVTPDVESANWVAEAAFAQNAAASVAYAAMAGETDDPQSVVWALRQAIEAADFADGDPSHSWSSRSLWATAALGAMREDLSQVEREGADLQALRARASSKDSWGARLALAW